MLHLSTILLFTKIGSNVFKSSEAPAALLHNLVFCKMMSSPLCLHPGPFVKFDLYSTTV